MVLAAVVAFGIPWILEAFNTVSTDDEFMNGHVTFVAGRVRGQVTRVLVDDDNRVRQGDLLVELDKEPYQTAVAVRQAAVDTAKADLQAASAMVRGIEAEARSKRWKLQHAMEDVADRIARDRSDIVTSVVSAATSQPVARLPNHECDSSGLAGGILVRRLACLGKGALPGGPQRRAQDSGDDDRANRQEREKPVGHKRGLRQEAPAHGQPLGQDRP